LVAGFAGRGSDRNFYFFTNKGHDDPKRWALAAAAESDKEIRTLIDVAVPPILVIEADVRKFGAGGAEL
jgi:hypothetical protein